MPGIELNDRENAILRAVVERHVRSARPVSSSAVARDSGVRLSSATIRNVMRALEERGLILQPHTSAGRIPTDMGYRYYVDNLMEPVGLSVHESDEIGAHLASLVHCDLATVLAGVSHMMSELSRELAVAVASSGTEQVLRRVSLVPVADGAVLAVATTDSGPPRTAVLTTGGVGNDELARANELLQRWLVGTEPSDASETVREHMSELESPAGDALRGLIESTAAFLGGGGSGRIHYDGARYIFRHPELSSDVAALGEILDSEESLADVVWASGGPARVVVVIGGENARRGMKRMSLVAGTYRIGGGVARMGVIGPTRMRYPRLIGLVDHFSRVLDELFAETS